MNNKYTRKDIKEAKDFVDKSNSILILGPDDQDGDSISANLALKTTFELMKKRVFWISAKGSNPLYDYLDGNQACADRKALKTLEDKIDLVILADLGSSKQIERSLETAPW